MAKERIWSALSPKTQAAYLKEGAKREMSESATKAYYGDPSNNLAILRRHVTKSGAPIPEHGLAEATRNRAKYQRYLEKRNVSLSPVELHSLKERAFQHHYRLLHETLKYNEATSRLNIIGDSEHPDEYPGMTAREAEYTLSLNSEQLRARASQQYQGNPWWYH